MENSCDPVEFFGDPISADGRERSDLAAWVEEGLRHRQAYWIRDFPTDVDSFIGFVERFGTSLPNYGSHTGLANYALHPKVNQVIYTDRVAADKYLHESGDALPPHAARSWRHPRPALFCLLMVEPGWTDNAVGSNGESLFVRWADVIKRCQDLGHDKEWRLLMETPVQFVADHVVEETSALPVIYELQDTVSEFDLGARVRGGFPSMAAALEPSLDGAAVGRDEYLNALQLFLDLAENNGSACCFQARRGDLFIVDNNRIGHGRMPTIPSRREGAGVVLNPREVWSVCLDF